MPRYTDESTFAIGMSRLGQERTNSANDIEGDQRSEVGVRDRLMLQ